MEGDYRVRILGGWATVGTSLTHGSYVTVNRFLNLGKPQCHLCKTGVVATL